jgi:Family of unknown function (DUF6101)
VPAGSSRGERLDPLARTVLQAPFAAYRGVAIRMQPRAGETAASVAVVLEHSDPALSLTLYRATDGADVVAEWRAWGQALAVPLLVAEADGRLREPFERIGGVRVASPAPRRRRRSYLAGRRPAGALRRQPGLPPARAIVHRGEHELIARK